jgi:hypothetical protein
MYSVYYSCEVALAVVQVHKYKTLRFSYQNASARQYLSQYTAVKIYMTAASANPLLPNLTQPVFPESLTATINALSPFLNAPIGLIYGLSSCFDAKKGKIRSYHVTSLVWVFGLGRFRRSYCGPTLFIGPTGSSGNVSNISLNWWIVGIGTVLPLSC